MVEPMARYYAARGLLVTVDVVGSAAEAAALALAALRQRSR